MELSRESDICYFCRNDIDIKAVNTVKQVVSWVGGLKSDGATLREDTGKYAHRSCLNSIKAGQAVDQPELFGEDS